MRLVVAVLLLLTLALQYALWFSRGGIRDVDKLKQSVAEQQAEIALLKERNRALSAEVIDLKQGLDAVEERARSEMGMIKNGEVFFRMTDQARSAAAAPPSADGGVSAPVEPALEPPLDPLLPADAGPPADLAPAEAEIPPQIVRQTSSGAVSAAAAQKPRAETGPRSPPVLPQRQLPARPALPP